MSVVTRRLEGAKKRVADAAEEFVTAFFDEQRVQHETAVARQVEQDEAKARELLMRDAEAADEVAAEADARLAELNRIERSLVKARPQTKVERLTKKLVELEERAASFVTAYEEALLEGRPQRTLDAIEKRRAAVDEQIAGLEEEREATRAEIARLAEARAEIATTADQRDQAVALAKEKRVAIEVLPELRGQHAREIAAKLARKDTPSQQKGGTIVGPLGVEVDPSGLVHLGGGYVHNPRNGATFRIE